MPPTVRAFSKVASSSATKANPVSVPKPTGLTVGDLMVAFIVTNGTTPTSYPSGFSLLMSDVATTAYHKGLVYTKVADSGDVAASQFTFGNPSLSSIFIGIYAVRDWGAIEYSACRGVVSGASSFPGFDPAASNDLMLAFDDRNSATAVAFSTTNNNPSWTVDSETAFNWYTACYHATYTADTATGTCQWAAVTAHRFEAMVAVSAATTLTAVAQTLSPTFNIRNLAAQTLTPAYPIRQLAAQSLIPFYDIQWLQVAQTLTPTYGVLNLAARTLTPTYLIRQLAAVTLTPVYDARQLVAQSLTPVYSMRQVVAGSLTPTYNLLTLIAQTFTLTYDIQAAGPTAVAQTLTPVYSLRQFTSQTLTPAYAMRNLAAQTLTPTYNMRQLVAGSLNSTYDVRQLVVTTITSGYDMRNLVSGTLAPQYSLRELVSATLTSTYGILGLIGPDVAFVVTLVPSGWSARLLREGWSMETQAEAWAARLRADGWQADLQPSGWKAAVRRDES